MRNLFISPSASLNICELVTCLVALMGECIHYCLFNLFSCSLTKNMLFEMVKTPYMREIEGKGNLCSQILRLLVNSSLLFLLGKARLIKWRAQVSGEICHVLSDALPILPIIKGMNTHSLVIMKLDLLLRSF